MINEWIQRARVKVIVVLQVNSKQGKKEDMMLQGGEKSSRTEGCAAVTAVFGGQNDERVDRKGTGLDYLDSITRT